MFKNKRGLSEVVTTLIILLLVLVAVGIIWAVVQGLIFRGTEDIDVGKFTLDLEIQSAEFSADGNNIDVNVLRKPGKGDIQGVKVIYTSDTQTGEKDFIEEFNELDSKTLTIENFADSVSNPTKVEIYPIFENDDTGKLQDQAQIGLREDRNLIIYVTSTTHNGKFGDTPKEALDEADKICNEDTNKPGASGTFKALLGSSLRHPATSSGRQSETDWIMQPTRTYYRFNRDTEVDTTDSNGWFTFDLTNSIKDNSPHNFVWTGLIGQTNSPMYYTGQVHNNCGDWIIDTTASSGLRGHSSYTDIRAVETSSYFCSFNYLLYCVEQP